MSDDCKRGRPPSTACLHAAVRHATGLGKGNDIPSLAGAKSNLCRDMRDAAVMATTVAVVGHMATAVEPRTSPSRLMDAFWRWTGRCLQPHTAPEVAAALRSPLADAPWSRLELTADVLEVQQCRTAIADGVRQVLTTECVLRIVPTGLAGAPGCGLVAGKHRGTAAACPRSARSDVAATAPGQHVARADAQRRPRHPRAGLTVRSSRFLSAC